MDLTGQVVPDDPGGPGAGVRCQPGVSPRVSRRVPIAAIAPLRIIISRAITRAFKARPVVLDAAGLSLVAYGVWLLEVERPGTWAIVVGVGLILAALRSQD